MSLAKKTRLNTMSTKGKRLVMYIVLSIILLLIGPVLLGGLGSWMGARFSTMFFNRSDSPVIDELRNDIMHLLLENAILREEAIKVDQYRILLGITRTGNRPALPARVLYRSEGLVTGTMVVDRGTSDGVVLNSVCISSSGLVGIVSSVHETTSEILPITNPSVNISCVTWPSGAYGILQSSSVGDLELVHVDLTSGVEIGDRVLTSRFGGVYPDGLLAGIVTRVSSGESGLALKLDVESAVDFRNTGEILILLPDETSSGNMQY